MAKNKALNTKKVRVAENKRKTLEKLSSPNSQEAKDLLNMAINIEVTKEPANEIVPAVRQTDCCCTSLP
jgi:hypothetical protein